MFFGGLGVENSCAIMRRSYIRLRVVFCALYMYIQFVQRGSVAAKVMRLRDKASQARVAC